MVLLRQVLGDALRARRQAQHRTLREVSGAANVSLGYLSEIERGQKEASSELLSAICDALGAQLSDVLRDASETLALAELTEAGLAPVGRTDADLVGAVGNATPAGEVAPGRAVVGRAAAGDAVAGEAIVTDLVGEVQTVTDGPVAVSVRREGPLKTTLKAVRPAAPRRDVVRAA
jgi:transcriptional regulator with XRE-family HTH domain